LGGYGSMAAGDAAMLDETTASTCTPAHFVATSRCAPLE
jgi:hypothetical protein